MNKERAKNLYAQCADDLSGSLFLVKPQNDGQGVDQRRLEIHKLGARAERERKVFETLALVGLNPEYVTRFAHEFSGGQRQRLAIARALAVEPKFIVCDEPISALDVSIQGQIVNLMKDLQKQFGLTYLFIAHDLSMVKYISDRVGVMYLGRLVELARKQELFDNPKHPYTQALLSCIPIPNPRIERQRKEIPIEGEIPGPFEQIAGCSFKTRCPYAAPACDKMEYNLIDTGSEHFVMCTKFRNTGDEVLIGESSQRGSPWDSFSHLTVRTP